MHAIFVDGVGHTREMEITHDTTCYFPSDAGVVEFRRIGTLPDGRVVLAQADVGWQLWGTQVVYTNAFAQHEQCAAYVDGELKRSMDNLNSRLMRVLYDVTEETPEFDGKTRHVYGVGIPTVH